MDGRQQPEETERKGQKSVNDNQNKKDNNNNIRFSSRKLRRIKSNTSTRHYTYGAETSF